MRFFAYACLFLCMMAPATAAPVPDAFLPTPAPTVRALLQQAQASLAVRHNYARFFHISDSRVVPFLQASAAAARLKRGGPYTQFCVRAGGTIYPAETLLPPNVRVFRLAGTGTFLARDTGNPLRRFAPVTQIRPAPFNAPSVLPTPPRQRVVPMKAQPVVVPVTRPQPVYQTPPAPGK